ncbi:MAG TPA: glycosyl hydrolase family 28-related protein, partial [Nitrospirota bacterium]
MTEGRLRVSTIKSLGVLLLAAVAAIFIYAGMPELAEAAKTVFQPGATVPSSFLNTVYYTGGGHRHDGEDADGHAGRIDPSTEINSGRPFQDLISRWPRIDVRAFGATGNGKTDDTAAINAAIAFAAAQKNPTLYFPAAAGNGYAATGTVTIPSGINVDMEAPVIYTGDSDIPALVVGSGKANMNVVLKLQAVRASQSSWRSENSVGIKVVNANSCDITIVKTVRFTVGAQFYGDGGGFSYNEVKLLYINSNKIGVDLNCTGGGWANENTFYGGRFCIDSTVNTGSSRYGVRITSADKYYSNNNIFIRPSFELEKKTTSGEA